MNYHIELQGTRFVELRRRLLELHPDLDEQTLADTLEGATDLKEALSALIRSALDDECLARALKDRFEAMRTRLARIEARATSKRQAALETMDAVDMRKLVEPEFTASLRRGPPAVSIVAEQAIPFDYLVPQPPKPDRRAILEALTAGIAVPGAELATPKLSLTIRSQ